MTRLLISVRSAAEAKIALAGGADLIDVKEPLHGALGAADGRALREIATAVAGRVPLSAALGELNSKCSDLPARACSLQGFQFAKVGLAGSANRNWRSDWRKCVAQFPHHVAPVAVIYGDWQACGAPAPAEVLQECQALSVAAVLIDTFDKNLGDLFVSMPYDDVASLLDTIHRAGTLSVVGGSLAFASAQRLLHLCPSFIAVRGAVCPDGRTGTIDSALVRAFKELLT